MSESNRDDPNQIYLMVYRLAIEVAELRSEVKHIKKVVYIVLAGIFTILAAVISSMR